MKNIELKIILFIALAISVLAILVAVIAKPAPSVLLGASPHYWYGATNSSSTIPTTATTTNPILSRDNSRIDAKVCYLSGTSTVFLHPLSQSTTTTVKINEGIPIHPFSSSTQPCESFPGFRGYLFGISETAATVTVSTHN